MAERQSKVSGPQGQAPEPAEKRHSFLRSTLSTFGAHLGVGVFSFLNVLIISRALGPSGRGQVALLTTIGVTMSFVCTLGVQEANVNFAGSTAASGGPWRPTRSSSR